MLDTIILRNAAEANWLRFSNPLEVLNVHDLKAVLPTLRYIEQRVERDGLFAAGFIGYEAAPAFDSACVVRHDAGFPLLRFGLFKAPVKIDTLPEVEPTAALTWQMDSAPAYYRGKISRIKAHIRAGDSYQVNFTVRQHAENVYSPWALFRKLAMDGPCTAPYAAYVNCRDWAICSASPELFFELDGDYLRARPMKGTASRGDNLREDEQQKSWLRNSEKNRAENLMIVDMIRSDMGRIAKPGSITVDNLFRVEVYPTTLQMTSCVRARTDRSVTDILRALFPCASITGAPKINTMRLIAALEDTPRRIYTGAIGCISPGRQVRFNVAIRTALVNRHHGHACYGSGGGIIWDSNADEELAEVATKSHILGSPSQRHYFQLLESLLWTGFDYTLLERHKARLLASARHFGFTVSEASIGHHLESLRTQLPGTPSKVRLLLAENGRLTSEYAPLGEPTHAARRVRLADHPVDPESIWLAHKTTVRSLYDEARAGGASIDDVLLWNTRGLLTESTTANLAIMRDGRWLTPALDNGLLAGTLRAELLETGRLQACDIPIAWLRQAREIRLLNSVREWIDVELV